MYLLEINILLDYIYYYTPLVVFYTGGDIWLSEGILSDGKIAVVNNEHPEILSLYKEPIDDIWYLSEDMIFSEHHNNLDDEHKEIYNQLLNQLNNTRPLY